jgi:DNA-binding transcriptional LysR family regulator
MTPSYHVDLLRSLEVFLCVAESGNMTAAARRLRITQSAISHHIKLLETDLGTRLIDRGHRPLRLTPAGTTLRHRGAMLLSQASEAVAEVRQVAAGPLPHLRIGIFATLARTVVPAIVKGITDGKLPIKHVSIMRGMAADHVRYLMNRNVEMVVTSNALYDLEGLERHELIKERFVLAVPRRTVRAGAGLREVAAQLPLLRYSMNTESGQLIERHLRRLRIDIPSTFMFDAPEDLLGTVAAGHGWAIAAPTQIVHAIDEKAPVDLHRLPGPGLERTITLVARTGELGVLPARIAALCRRVLSRQHVPLVRRLMPALTDCFAILTESSHIG